MSCEECKKEQRYRYKTKIPQELDQKVREKFKSWSNYLETLHRLSNLSSNFDDWIVKQIYGITYPLICLPDESVLRHWLLNYNFIGNYKKEIYELEIWQYESHHPFKYILNVTDLTLTAVLTTKPFSLDEIFKYSLNICDAKFIKKCKKWRSRK